MEKEQTLIYGIRSVKEAIESEKYSVTDLEDDEEQLELDLEDEDA